MPALRPIPSDGAKGVYLVPMSEYDKLAREHGEMREMLSDMVAAELNSLAAARRPIPTRVQQARALLARMGGRQA